MNETITRTFNFTQEDVERVLRQYVIDNYGPIELDSVTFNIGTKYFSSYDRYDTGIQYLKSVIVTSNK